MNLRGKGVEEVVKEVKESVEGIKEGMVLIQGGGNSLRKLGTVDKLMEDRRNVRVVVLRVMRHPRESGIYEEVRKETNKQMQEEVQKIKIEIKESDAGDYEWSEFHRLGRYTPTGNLCGGMVYT